MSAPARTQLQPGLLVSLTGVAQLARVQRPVVSMWRRRSQVAGSQVPFPSPVGVTAREERFRVDEVVDWLERTRRGNNPDARGDAPAYAELPELDLADDERLVGAAALLTVRSVTGSALAGRDADGLLDLADEADPDDELLFAEIERLPPDARVALAAYVDDLVDAAYGVAPALDSLMKRAGSAAQSQLAPPLRDLVGRAVAAIAQQLDLSPVRLVEPTGQAADLVAAALAALGEGVDAEIVAGRRGAAIRELRRIAALRGWTIAGEGTADPALGLARIPDPGEHAVTAADLLTVLDNVQLSLSESQRALVLGPAWLLCDALGDPELDRQRDHMVRLGRVRAVVRLPAGLVLTRSRQPCGLWLLGPESAARLEDKAMTTADLTDVALTGDAVEDLVTDLIASLDPRQLGREHAYRFARVCRTATLLAGRGPLVPTGVAPGPVRPVGGAHTVIAVRALLDALARPPDHLGTLDVAPDATRPDHPAYLTVAEGKAAGTLRIIAGTRLPDGLNAGSAPVVGAAELLSDDDDAGPARSVDPLELALRYPGVRRTEPGDVIFVVTPRPWAKVEHDGGSVVRSPARVLRCRKDSGLVPEVVAHAVNALPADAKHWHGWHLPVVDAAHAADLSAALAAIDRERLAARRRQRDLARLADALVEGAATNSLVITTKES
ncbi:MAG: hypothetical protein ACOYBY_10545 [Dermatophilaceae bacterium]